MADKQTIGLVVLASAAALAVLAFVRKDEADGGDNGGGTSPPPTGQLIALGSASGQAQPRLTMQTVQ